MDIKTLMPWSRGKTAPSPRMGEETSPFLALHREMNRLFDDFFHDFDAPMARLGWSSTWPRVELADSAQEVTVTAELPGMDEKDIELTLQDGTLTLKGEKKTEATDTRYSERWQGRFERSLHLGADIDPQKVTATVKNGVLTVVIAKKPEAERTAKRIPIGG